MCLNVTTQETKLAEKDIICFKVGKIHGNEFSSPYRSFYI
jgi:hypothetical protein